MKSVEAALPKSFIIHKKYFWCDLKIALAWIKSTDKEFKPFIENRLTEKRSSTDPKSWNYVNTRLTYEEMQTILYEVEHILNNRPLTNCYPDELQDCLSPNHLLYRRILPYRSTRLSSFGEESDSFSNISDILNHYWERWSLEYVTNLREYHKTTERNRHQPTPKAGDIVLVNEKRLPRSMWRIGRVTKLHGHQGIRGATIKTSTSYLSRPINLLYPIELVERTEKVTAKEEDDSISKRPPRRDAALCGELKRRYAQI